MPTDYEMIIQARSDLSPRLIHFTRSDQTLLSILRSGYLKPSFAERTSYRTERTKRTILGPDPAVCFTEMPLAALKALCGLALRTPRYAPFGVSFDKSLLFRHGARPVIYGDDRMLAGLPDHLQYLWVRLDLGDNEYVTDWTHEREWRIRFRENDREYYQYDGVPLEFGLAMRLPSFEIICKSTADVQQIRDTIGALTQVPPAEDCEPEWYAAYVARVQATAPRIWVLDDL